MAIPRSRNDGYSHTSQTHQNTAVFVSSFFENLSLELQANISNERAVISDSSGCKQERLIEEQYPITLHWFTGIFGEYLLDI